MCDPIPNNLVVINPLESPRIVSRPRTTEDIFDASSEGRYSVLTCPNEPRKLVYTTKKCHNLHLFSLVNRITLKDFPMGQHILRANGWNLMTATRENGDYVFAIDSPTRSDIMTTMVHTARGNNEEDIPDRHRYLNTSRIDSIEILSTPAITEDQMVIIEGIRRVNGEWKSFQEPYHMKVKDEPLDLNWSVRDIVFTSPKEDFEVSLRLNQQVFGPFASIDKQLRIGFENFVHTKGIQNDYLSEKNNKETINMSRVFMCKVISTTDELLVREYAYKTYNIYGIETFCC